MEIKNAFNGLISTQDTEKERISNLWIPQLKLPKLKRKKKKGEKRKRISKNFQRTTKGNMCIMEMPEAEERKEQKNYVKEQ